MDIDALIERFPAAYRFLSSIPATIWLVVAGLGIGLAGRAAWHWRSPVSRRIKPVIGVGVAVAMLVKRVLAWLTAATLWLLHLVALPFRLVGRALAYVVSMVVRVWRRAIGMVIGLVSIVAKAFARGCAAAFRLSRLPVLFAALAAVARQLAGAGKQAASAGAMLIARTLRLSGLRLYRLARAITRGLVWLITGLTHAINVGFGAIAWICGRAMTAIGGSWAALIGSQAVRQIGAGLRAVRRLLARSIVVAFRTVLSPPRLLLSIIAFIARGLVWLLVQIGVVIGGMLRVSSNSIGVAFSAIRYSRAVAFLGAGLRALSGIPVRLVRWLASTLGRLVAAIVALTRGAWHVLVAALGAAAHRLGTITQTAWRLLRRLVHSLATSRSIGALAAGARAMQLAAGRIGRTTADALSTALRSTGRVTLFILRLVLIPLRWLGRALAAVVQVLGRAMLYAFWLALVPLGLVAKGISASLGFGARLLTPVARAGTRLACRVMRLVIEVLLVLPRFAEVFVRAIWTAYNRITFVPRAAIDVLVLGLAVSVMIIALRPPPQPTFRIVAGSGHATFEPILKQWATANRVNLEITYKGSLDIMLMLQSDDFPYDAIWEADALWTTLSESRDIKGTRSIMCSPIVYGVKMSLARDIGWIGRADVPMRELLDTTESRKLRVLMTSATQSNSGASAYFGFLYAFAGQPDVLTADHLKDPAVLDPTKRLMNTINRTSESSGWLRDLFVSDYDQYDAMFNYESHIIEANQKLVQAGKDPLYIIYPKEGLGLADFPLSFVTKGNADKEPLFNTLRDFLVGDSVQAAIAAKGRRVGPLCDRMEPAAARAEWGVDPTRVLNVLKYPTRSVIWDALSLYQTEIRKPSFTVYCLDFSGSMEGVGEQKLREAMRTLLDDQEARRFLLQSTPNDVNIVLPFNHTIMNGGDTDPWAVMGNAPAALTRLLGQIAGVRPSGRTDIYQPVVKALETFQSRGIGGRFPAIILMTDGESNAGSLADVQRAIARTGQTSVPVYGITFGEASVTQLAAIASQTKGRVFDGTRDLISAFRSAKGNN